MTWSERSLTSVTERVEKREPATLDRSTFRYVDIGSIDSDRHAIVGAQSLRTDAAPGRARQVLRTGDTVFSTVRPYLEKIALVGEHFDGEIASTGFCVLRPGPLLDPKYLFYFATSRRLLDQVLPLQRGVSYPAVLDKDVLGAAIPVPDLDVQRRIVDILEDHLSRLDAAEEQVSAAITRARAFEAAFIRSLVPESSVATLADLSSGSGYGTSTKCDRAGKGAPVVRIPNLVDGRIDLRDEKRSVDTTVDLTRLMLAPGDLLVIRTNGSRDLIGRTAVVQDGIQASFASYLIRYRLRDDKVLPHWVQLMMATPESRSFIESLAASSAGQYNLSLAKLDSVRILVPPLSDQHVLLSKVEELTSTTSRLASTGKSTLSRSATLRRALLQAAFSGNLTGTASDADRMEELAAGD